MTTISTEHWPPPTLLFFQFKTLKQNPRTAHAELGICPVKRRKYSCWCFCEGERFIYSRDKVWPYCLHSNIGLPMDSAHKPCRRLSLVKPQWAKQNLWTHCVRLSTSSQLTKVRNWMAISIIDGMNQWVIVLSSPSLLPASFFTTSMSRGFRLYPVTELAPFTIWFSQCECGLLNW